MEIRSLNLIVTNDDLNHLAKRHLPAKAPVRNLKMRIEPEGIYVKGDYPGLLLPIPFETLWEMSVKSGEVQARLARIKIVGVPAGVLRGVFMNAFGKIAASEPGLRVENDTVIVNVDTVLLTHGLSVRTNLTAVRCLPGHLILEA